MRSFSPRVEIRSIKPRPRVEGEVVLPGDKSISHQAIILNSLARGKAEIDNIAPGRDCMDTVKCLRALGVKIGKKGS